MVHNEIFCLKAIGLGIVDLVSSSTSFRRTCMIHACDRDRGTALALDPFYALYTASALF